MKVWKRNAVVAAIVLFVCVAVYLNWSYGQKDALASGAAGSNDTKTLGEAELVGGDRILRIMFSDFIEVAIFIILRVLSNCFNKRDVYKRQALYTSFSAISLPRGNMMWLASTFVFRCS